MPRCRLLPTPAQEAVLPDHCGHARYIWNLAVEQHAHWHPGRKGAPGYLEQCRQLTAARAGHPWLTAGSQTVQQQALRDFAQAMTAFADPGNPAGRPSWRKAGRDEGFRIVGRGRRWQVRHPPAPRRGPEPADPAAGGRIRHPRPLRRRADPAPPAGRHLPATEPMVSATSSCHASVNAGSSAWLTPHRAHRSRGTKIFQYRPASRT